MAKYFPAHKLEDMPALLGSSQAEHDRFFKYQQMCIDQTKEAGQITKISWPKESKLERVSESKAIIETPAQMGIPECDYVVK